jgi:glycosyltransferase involved in cell wall biosynthesis
LLRINWVGQNDVYEGYSIYSMKHLFGVSTLPNINVTPISFDQLSWPARAVRLANLDFSAPLVHVGLPSYEMYAAYPGKIFTSTMYEGTVLREGWVETMNRFCQAVFVPSEWCKEVFLDNGLFNAELREQAPIYVTPGGVDFDEFYLIEEKVDRPFTFLCLGDRGRRKGVDLSLRAFSDAFGRRNNNVRLIVKAREFALDALVEYLSDPRIKFFRYDAGHMNKVYPIGDCFVFPTRGEGYGMPPREAVAMGVPTICTAQGGTADAAEWAFPLSYKYEKADKEVGGRWASPNYDELVMHMRAIYENQQSAKEHTLKGRQYLMQHANWDLASKVYQEVFNKFYGP